MPGAEAGQVQKGSWRRFRRRSGRLWCRARSGNRVPEKVWEALVQPGQVQQGSGEGSRRRFPEKVWEALVQSQVRFNRVPEKVPEKVPGSLGAKPSQVQRVPEKVPEKAWEALVQSQVRFNRVPEKVFPALGFAARFRKICKNRTLRLLGIPPIFFDWNNIFLVALEYFFLMRALTRRSARCPAKAAIRPGEATWRSMPCSINCHAWRRLSLDIS